MYFLSFQVALLLALDSTNTNIATFLNEAIYGFINAANTYLFGSNLIFFKKMT